MALSPRDVLDAARILVEKKYPYFRAAIYKIRPMKANGLKTMAMDAHGRMLWDEETVAEWGPKGTAPAFHHEICHFLREHAERRADHGFNPMIWNLGADAEINDEDLFKGDWKLPVDEPVFASRIGKYIGVPSLVMDPNLTAEEYTRRLIEELRKQQQNGSSTGSEKGDDSSDDDGDGSGSSNPMNNPDKRKGKGPGSGHCGGCAGNAFDEEGDTDKDGSKNENSVPPLTESEKEVTRQKVAQDVIEHSQSRGNVPADWLDWAKATLTPPRIPWQKVLAKHVRSSLTRVAGQTDFTYARIARSYAARRHVLGKKTPISPGMYKPVPQVAIVTDRSGSMGSGEGSPLELSLCEVRGVIRSVGAAVTVFATDTAVNECKNVFSDQSIHKLNRTGGGTDMRVGIEAADKAKPKADLIILMTDGYTPWPERNEMPRAELIVVLIGDDVDKPPEWIKRVIHVPIDDLKPVTMS